MEGRTHVGAREALERLREGNWRFVANVPRTRPLLDDARRAELIAGQAPFAIVLGCSDSRAPAEIVFDQGLGDLFVIRVAGNIVAPSLVGSVEFAAEQFGTRLVVVMGHTHCGAVTATIHAVLHPGDTASRNLRSIVDRIRPVAEPLVATPLRDDFPALRRAVMRANVRASVEHLRHGSEVIERLGATHGLAVVGAEYDLASGRVTFLDEV